MCWCIPEKRTPWCPNCPSLYDEVYFEAIAIMDEEDNIDLSALDGAKIIPKNKQPEWWPKNPYFESAMGTIASDKDFAKAIPDPQLRTAIAWYLSNRAWQLASDEIFRRWQEAMKEYIND